MKKSFILFLLVCLSCGKHENPEKESPPPEVVELYNSYSDRLVKYHLDSGFVVSRYKGEPRHQGDAMIWTGMALYALPCDKVGPLLAGVWQMVQDLGGGLYRHPDLHDKISLDGALGFYRGMARLVKECPEHNETALRIMEFHAKYVGNSSRINPHHDLELVREFTYVRDAVLWAYDMRHHPSDDRLQFFGAQIAAWAKAVKTARAPCFRVHLGLISLQTIEAVGKPIPGHLKAAFCLASDGMGLPTRDHWCGDKHISDWISDFKLNEWEYRHQRCPDWEGPDGKDYESPALDLLVGIRDGFNL